MLNDFKSVGSLVELIQDKGIYMMIRVRLIRNWIVVSDCGCFC